MNNETNLSTPTSQSSLVKDLAMPVAIVLAGAFIGLGFFFSGEGGSKSDQVAIDIPTAQQPQAPATAGTIIPQLVQEIGVDRGDFEECFNSERTEPNVQEDADNAVATGGRGTPWSVVIGPSGKTYPLNGAVPAAQITSVIEQARAEAGQGPTGEATDSVNPVTANDFVKGDRNAAVTIVEYSDFDCPFCSRFHTTMNSVLEGESDVAWVYRHFPLDQLHPEARAVARAAECVGELEGEEAFWEFTDGYFAAKG